MRIVHEVNFIAEILDTLGERYGVVHWASSEVEAIRCVGVHTDETNFAHFLGNT